MFNDNILKWRVRQCNIFNIEEENVWKFPSIQASTNWRTGYTQKSTETEIQNLIQKLAEIWRRQLKSRTDVHRGSKDKITIYLRLISTQNNVSKYKAQKEHDYTVLLVYTVVKYSRQLTGPLPWKVYNLKLNRYNAERTNCKHRTR